LQKLLHLPEKGLLSPTGGLSRHPELVFKVCLPPVLLLHVVSSLNIFSSTIFHYKNTKISYCPSVQLSECIEYFFNSSEL